MRRFWIVLNALFFGVWLPGASAAATESAGKPPLTYTAYDGWRSIQDTRLARNGRWAAYVLSPQEGDSELVVRELEGAREIRQPLGKDPVFSVDGRFVVYTVKPSHAELEKARGAKLKPEAMPKNGLGILNLATGAVEMVARVRSFSLPDGMPSEGKRIAAPWLAYLLEPPPPAPDLTATAPTSTKKGAGTELVLRNLATGARLSVPDVTEYAWNASGSWIACLVDAPGDDRDGIVARGPEAGGSRSLLLGAGKYRRLTWDRTGRQFAFLSDRDDPNEGAAFKLYLWEAGEEAAHELISSRTPGMPLLMGPSEHGALSFSQDGSRLFLGVAPKPETRPKDAPTPLNVDLWHWKDGLLQTMQKVRAEAERKHTFTAVVHLRERRLVPLASRSVPVVGRPDEGEAALGEDRAPYLPLISWERSYRDFYLVNVRTGKAERVVEKSGANAALSPEGKYLLYFRDEEGAWYARRVADGKVVNLTAGLRVGFSDEEQDRPDFPDAYGSAGWTNGDRSVLLYDRYDIWEINPDTAEARAVTGGVGRRQKLVFRYQKVDPEERAISTDAPLLLSVTDDRTKASGYYRVSLDRCEPEKLLLLDKQLIALTKAEEADRYILRAQRFEEYPDLWTANGELRELRKISDANPQQSKFRWGRAELIDYRNADGKKLQAVLLRPDGFDPKREYPLLVYIYEKLADRLHRYYAPGTGTSPNLARYVSNGYLVLLPDIVYKPGKPGESCYDCVVPAVKRVVRMGGVDPKRIGISGHSWGGYQASYLLTRTEMFRAAEAGAPVANMTSAYGGIRWESGMSRAAQYEAGQSRIGATPWEKPGRYLENSPLFRVDRVKTPYLSLHNDADGAVPWYQGIEFFSALRRLGKEAYLFNYNGEGHGLRARAAQKHWTVHMDEFFDHYLLGKPRPDWMKKGVPFLQRGTRDVAPLFKRNESPEVE